MFWTFNLTIPMPIGRSSIYKNMKYNERGQMTPCLNTLVKKTIIYQKLGPIDIYNNILFKTFKGLCFCLTFIRVSRKIFSGKFDFQLIICSHITKSVYFRTLRFPNVVSRTPAL